MKNIRLIMSSVAAVAALTATGGYPQAASAQTLSAQTLSAQTLGAQTLGAQTLGAQTLSAQTLSAQALSAQALGAQTLGAHSVNWGDVTIPGHLCKVNGPIKLHNGRAFVRHSGFGMALDVLMLTVSRGSLGHGLHVAALQIWCDNTGGTADGELAEGIFVFDSPGGHPHLLGTLTPQLKGNPMLHIPFIVVNRIETTGHVAVTESFYNSVDPTCCPSGHATTLWKWTGRTFIPGRTHITST